MSASTQETNPSGCLHPLVRLGVWFRQLVCSHRFDYSDLVGRSTPDGNVTWPCYKCGKSFSRYCGLEVLDHGSVGQKPNSMI